MNSSRQMGNVFRRTAKAFKAAIRHWCESTGDTESDVADLLKIDKGQLNNMCNAHWAVHADLVVQLARLGVTGPVKELCALSGGYYMEIPTRGADDLDLAKTVKAFGEYVTEYAGAIADGAIDADEIERLEREGSEAITAIKTLMDKSNIRRQVDDLQHRDRKEKF